jgi:hypothetical protein
MKPLQIPTVPQAVDKKPLHGSGTVTEKHGIPGIIEI